MGVKDLWQLLAPAGRYSSLESLKHKRIAIGTRSCVHVNR
jgi:hypothetical protein